MPTKTVKMKKPLITKLKTLEKTYKM